MVTVRMAAKIKHREAPERRGVGGSRLVGLAFVAAGEDIIASRMRTPRCRVSS